jgi:ribosomal protein L32
MGIWKTSNADTKELTEKLDNKSKELKEIKESKCTCSACGNVWYYGKQEVREQQANAMSNVGKSMMCCGGCLPSLFIPNKKVVDLNKCPKCGSRAIKKEEVIHCV